MEFRVAHFVCYVDFPDERQPNRNRAIIPNSLFVLQGNSGNWFNVFATMYIQSQFSFHLLFPEKKTLNSYIIYFHLLLLHIRS